MNRTTEFKDHDISRIDRPDGSILLTSNAPLGPVVTNTSQWLHHWAAEAGERVFLAERSGAGWRAEGYASVLGQVRAVAASLMARGLDSTTPILILSGNGIDNGVLTLAAQYVGVPTVPVAEQYSLIKGAHGRLRHVVELVRPSLVYVADSPRFAAALALDALAGVEIVASDSGDASLGMKITPFDDLLQGDATVDLAAANAAVTADTVAKILMTSGSTSVPKGVLTTHGMMCTNQTQLGDALPFLRERPPRIVDWLPWNHVFGGSHNFNMMLAFGGSLYIDQGKPVPGLFDQTVENLGMVTGTLAFNVPAGFTMLLAALQADKALRHRFFETLDLIFYAGASLPQDVWEGFEAMAMEIKGEVPLMTSSWGLTETAPSVLIQQEPTSRSGVVGIPMTAVTTKLIANDENRYEIRVKGPNIMPGYFEDAEKTAAAFDEEGFFITGDAMKFVDPDNPNAGLKFDGRISEDFKLLTGTWVRAAQLRLDILAVLGAIVADVVITGADRDQIGLLIFPAMDEVHRRGLASPQDGVDDSDAFTHPDLLAEIADKLAAHARTVSGSSNIISRALIMREPVSLIDGEVTAKGNLNFNKVLDRRRHLLARLYDDADHATVTLQDN